MIFIIPEPDDKARQKIDLKFFGCPWIFSYYIKIHSAGPSENVGIFLAKVKIVRLQVFSYYIKLRSAGPSRIGAVSGE